MKRGKWCLWLILLGITARIAPLPLYDYALPHNSMRAKLHSLLQENQGALKFSHDKTWVDFGSWHWSIGQLATEDNIKFVIKTAKYPADTAITTPQYPGLVQTHTPHQNISRVYRAVQAQKIIAKHQLDKMKVPLCWAYPLSGNDTDLCKSTIDDHQVIIVEEMIKKKSDDTAWCSYVSDNVQADTLRLDKKTFDQLVTFAQNGTFLDLTPKNLLVDQQGNVVAIDLEDTLARQKKRVENANVLLRPLKAFKLRCQQEGYALYGVGITGLSNTMHAEVKKRGQQLVNKSRCTLLIKKNVFEITAIALVIVGALIYMLYGMCATRKINTYIRKCTRSMSQILHDEQIYEAPQEIYQAIAQRVVKSIVPHENRGAIVNAFATIAIAQHMKKQWDRSQEKIIILGTSYISPQKAIRKAEKKIQTLWRSYTPWQSNGIKIKAEQHAIGVMVDW